MNWWMIAKGSNSPGWIFMHLSTQVTHHTSIFKHQIYQPTLTSKAIYGMGHLYSIFSAFQIELHWLKIKNVLHY